MKKNGSSNNELPAIRQIKKVLLIVIGGVCARFGQSVPRVFSLPALDATMRPLGEAGVHVCDSRPPRD